MPAREIDGCPRRHEEGKGESMQLREIMTREMEIIAAGGHAPGGGPADAGVQHGGGAMRWPI
jgi:hypothetical protein